MHSILLIKPDGVASTEKLKEIERQITEQRLTVVDLVEERLECRDVAGIWPKFDRPHHRFTLSMLGRYLTSGPSHLLTVHGDEVITQCLAVRSRVRQRFGWSAFENSVHTPADENERLTNLAYLAPHLLTSDFHVSIDDSAGAGAFGRFAELSDDEVDALTRELWGTKVATEWTGLRHAADHTVLWLQPGSANSIDYEIAVLADVFSHRPVSWCAQRFVEAEIFGRAPLTGPAETADVSAVKRRLDAQGVLTTTDDDE